MLVRLGVLGALIVVIFFAVHFTPSPPTEKYGAMAVGIEGAPQRQDRGVRVDMHITVNSGILGCRNPVEVVAVVSGTTEFWRHWRSRLDSPTRVVMALSGGLEEWQVGLASSAKDVFRPEYARPVRASELADEEDTVATTPGEQASDADTATAELHDWGRTRVPLVATFDADWVARRTLGSCYLRIPALTSNAPGAGAQATNAVIDLLAEGTPPTDEVLPASHGRITVRAAGARLRSDLSSPSPNASASDDPLGQSSTWVCQASATEQVGSTSETATSPTGVIALPGATASTEQGCGGFAVLEVSWAEPVREIALIVLGGLITAAGAALTRLRRQSKAQGP
jgi:hypothetical protein